MMSMMPVQNTGRLTPVTATPMLRRSSQEYCLTAETMPAAKPSTTAMSERAGREHERRLEAEQDLGEDGSRPSGMERPRSPCTTCPIHRRYCTTSG